MIQVHLKIYLANMKRLIKKKSEIILTDIKDLIEICEKENLTNEQWYIDWEIELNKLSVKDHNKINENE